METYNKADRFHPAALTLHVLAVSAPFALGFDEDEIDVPERQDNREFVLRLIVCLCKQPSLSLKHKLFSTQVTQKQEKNFFHKKSAAAYVGLSSAVG